MVPKLIIVLISLSIAWASVSPPTCIPAQWVTDESLSDCDATAQPPHSPQAMRLEITAKLRVCCVFFLIFKDLETEVKQHGQSSPPAS